MSSVECWASPDGTTVVRWDKGEPLSFAVYGPGDEFPVRRYPTEREAIKAARRRIRYIRNREKLRNDFA